MPVFAPDASLPTTVTTGRMDDAEFTEVIAQNPDLFFEMTAAGELIVMPPSYTTAGLRIAKITHQLAAWAESEKTGLAFGATVGYVLPNGARRSPHVSWISRERAGKLDDYYLRGTPDFAVETNSEMFPLETIREKMREYTDNGTPLAWLIDPMRRVVEIYRPGRAPEIRSGPTSIEGEAPVAGFVLNLQRVWDPIR